MRRSKRNLQQSNVNPSNLTESKSTNTETQSINGDQSEVVVKSKYFKSDAKDGEEKPSCSVVVSENRLTRHVGDSYKSKPIIKLTRKDFEKEGLQQARYLLGKIINVHHSGAFMRGRIVETEAYLGVKDKACHAYCEKRTARTEAMFMVEGTSYVYSIYGMYHCFNISSSSFGGATLIRALEPIEGIEQMREKRAKSKKSGVKTIKTKDLCNGPSKLCQAMGITKEGFNCVDMVHNDDFFVSDDAWTPGEIVVCKRIGVEGYGGEAANKPYRFYVKGNVNVSVINKEAKEGMTTSTKKSNNG